MKLDFLDNNYSSLKNFEESEFIPKSILRDTSFQLAPTFNVRHLTRQLSHTIRMMDLMNKKNKLNTTRVPQHLVLFLIKVLSLQSTHVHQWDPTFVRTNFLFNFNIFYSITNSKKGY